MTNILLCDDDAFFLDLLEDKISALEYDIHKFTSISQVLASKISFDIAFLDIELGNSDSGFSLVNHIRRGNPKCVISFFTNYRDYAVDGYEYQPYRYILKDDPDKIISKKISDTFTEFHRVNTLIKGSYHNKTFAVSPSDIYYVETYRHIITLHTKKGNFELYRQINEMYDELAPFGFIRCHRSYIVNPRYIEFLKNDTHFILSEPSDIAIPVGIRYKKSAKDSYLSAIL